MCGVVFARRVRGHDLVIGLDVEALATVILRFRLMSRVLEHVPRDEVTVLDTVNKPRRLSGPPGLQPRGWAVSRDWSANSRTPLDPGDRLYSRGPKAQDEHVRTSDGPSLHVLIVPLHGGSVPVSGVNGLPD